MLQSLYSTSSHPVQEAVCVHPHLPDLRQSTFAQLQRLEVKWGPYNLRYHTHPPHFDLDSESRPEAIQLTFPLTEERGKSCLRSSDDSLLRCLEAMVSAKLIQWSSDHLWSNLDFMQDLLEIGIVRISFTNSNDPEQDSSTTFEESLLFKVSQVTIPR